MDTQQRSTRPVPLADEERRATPEPGMQFITFNDPKGFKDAATQKLIRKQVMGQIGRARRRRGTKRERAEIPLDVRLLQNYVEQEEPSASNALTAAGSRLQTVKLDWLGAGEVDPFVKYPIELDSSSRILVVNIFRATGASQRALRDAWYPVGLSDMAAFHIVLSNSAAHLNIIRNGLDVTREDPEDLGHQALAIRSVNERLSDPNHRIRDGVIGTIAGFICHDYIIGAFNRWNIHMNGLKEIIKLRGGVQSITKEKLRLTLSWVDLCGAYSQDIEPQFSLPSQWLPYADPFAELSSERPLETAISSLWKQELSQNLGWINIFDDLVAFTTRMNCESSRHGVLYWENTTDAGAWTNPTIHRLLKLRPISNGFTRGSLIEEVCRIGSLLYLAPVWRKFGVFPVRTARLRQALVELLTKHVVDWGKLRPLLFWAIILGSFEVTDSIEKHWFASTLATLMRALHMSEWSNLMGIVKNILWSEDVFTGRDDIIRREVTAILEISDLVESSQAPMWESRRSCNGHSGPTGVRLE